MKLQYLSVVVGSPRSLVIKEVFIGNAPFPNNVWGEPIFSVMAAGWFCDKIRLNWESGGCETSATTDFNQQPF
jgi:hypothetical protein